MAVEAKKSEGPACACGKVDLYMESLKLQEHDLAGVTDSSMPSRADENKSSDDPSDSTDQIPELGK